MSASKYPLPASAVVGYKIADFNSLSIGFLRCQGMNKTALIKTFVVGWVVVALIALGSTFHLFRGLNLAFHDAILSLPGANAHQPKTLVISNDLPLDSRLAAKLDTLVRMLRSADAKDVVFLLQSPALQHIVFDMREPVTVALPEQPGFDLNRQRTETALAFDSIEGAYRTALMPEGVAVIGNIEMPEALLGTPFYLNYFYRLTSLPKLNLHQALQGSLISELVAGKLVLVDLEAVLASSRLHVPDPQVGEMASYGELQALALETIASGQMLTFISPLLAALVFLLMYTGNFFALQMFSARGLVWSTLVIALVIALLAAAALRFLHLLLPVTELVLIQLFSVGYFIALERAREESLMSRITAQIRARLIKKVDYPSFFQAEDPWQNLHLLINQQMTLRRSIFLEKVVADHRVKEIHALNCSIDDIQERRRDYERRPYSDAITTLRPVRLSDRQFFTDLQAQEVEYLVPLLYGGNVLGFWAMTIIPGDDWEARPFENNLASFGKEIAELLVHRQRYHQQSRKENRFLHRLLTLKMAQIEFDSLSQSVEALEHRYDELQDVFNGMSTASVLYNLFGRVIHSNQAMDRIAQQMDMPIYNFTAHDFLLQLTSMASRDIKQLLLDVTLRHNEVYCNLEDKNLQENYVLKVRPVKVEEEEKGGTPFLLRGILFEFIDVPRIHASLEARTELYGQYLDRLQGSFDSIHDLVGALRRRIAHLGDPELPGIVARVRAAESVVSLIKSHVDASLVISQGVAPLRIDTQINDLLAVHQAALERKEIQVTLEDTDTPLLALVKPDQFTGLLEQILQLLIVDCEGVRAALTIRLQLIARKREPDSIRIYFENQGYGLSKDELEQLTAANASQSSVFDGPLEQLLAAAAVAATWGCKLELDAELGKGYRISLTVPSLVIGGA